MKIAEKIGMEMRHKSITGDLHCFSCHSHAPAPHNPLLILVLVLTLNCEVILRTLLDYERICDATFGVT